ncbi:DUF309 domain-containing protein [Thermosynechococcus sp. B3]|uniref:DUF309 domain-containing protein n=1 Tax=unclassified Thermosynechococcus TaxID=2622553 RepID=UPI0025758637|nr:MULTISPECIES: DUF309 domain-containing protein [unclassified Thermosynechococcus]WJI26523.1 DUF309 domain-containing protein [Thermosynechococcus sp. B1]WJI29049.1 DUF309 domain-containing protein [Thermosynechococcus sp. B3]
MPPELALAIGQFNRGEFYACHDTLEALWLEASEPERTFYQGLLQIAVACYHLSRGNQRGAILLLGEGRRRLEQCDPDFCGLDLTAFLTAVAALQAQLQTPLDSEPKIQLHLGVVKSLDQA